MYDIMDVFSWIRPGKLFNLMIIMMFRIIYCSFTYFHMLFRFNMNGVKFSSPPLAPAGTVEAASLRVSCCIPAEQVSSNLLQNILFETFCVAGGSFFACLLCAGAHLAC